MKNYINALILFAAIIATSCEETNQYGPIAPSGNMVISAENLPALSEGFSYEGWIVSEGTTSSAGKFQANSDGVVDNLTVPVESSRLENASAFKVTIESNDNVSGDPLGAVIMSGNFGEYEAELNTQSMDAIGIDPADEAIFSGKFLINAPTTATTEDDTSGIWFIDKSSGIAQAGLSLPSLSSQWVYEGWVIIEGQPVSTGRFTVENSADGSCNYCGPLTAPAFPGEDFVMDAPTGLSFPTNIAGLQTVISIEPEPDNSEDPFSIKVLSGNIPGEATIEIGTSYDMEFLNSGSPKGNVLRFFGFDCTNDGCI